MKVDGRQLRFYVPDCNHASRNLYVVRRDPSPTGRDKDRVWTVLLCRKCGVSKAGYENGNGHFRLSYKQAVDATTMRNLIAKKEDV